MKIALQTTMLAAVLFAVVETRIARAENLSSAFTYQGRLLLNDEPVNGSYDFKFKLYKDPDGITQAGSTIQLDGQQVVDGLVTVQLDFGTQAFTGPDQRRWLLTRLKASGGLGCPIINPNCDLYTSLLPRQELTPAPFALGIPGLWKEAGAVLHASSAITSDIYVRGVELQSETTVSAGDGELVIDGLNRKIKTSDGTLSIDDAAGSGTVTIDGPNGTITTSTGVVSLAGNRLVTSGIIESTAGGIKFPDGSIMTEVPASFVKNALEASDGSPTNAVFVDAVGKVGIGTTSPPQKLSLVGGDFLLKTSDNTADQSILFQNLGDFYTWRIYRTESSPDQADFRIAGGKQLDPAALTDHLTINHTGEIGIGTSLAIGTTTPQVGSFAALHVMGSQLGAMRADHADGSPLLRLDRDYAILGGSGYLSLLSPKADAGNTTRHSPALLLGGSQWTGSAQNDFYWIGTRVDDTASDTRLSFGTGLGNDVMMSVSPTGLDLNGTAKLFNGTGDRTIEISPDDSEVRLYNDFGLERIAIDGKTASGGGVIRIANSLGNPSITLNGDDTVGGGVLTVMGDIGVNNMFGSPTILLDGGAAGTGELTVLGKVGIGTTTPDYALHVVANGHPSDGHIAKFENTGSTAASGIAIQLDNTRTNAGNDFLTFYRADGTAVGAVEGFDLVVDILDTATVQQVFNDLPSFGEIIDLDGFFDPGSVTWDGFDIDFDAPSIDWNAIGGGTELFNTYDSFVCWAMDNDLGSLVTTNPFDIAVGIWLTERSQACKNGGSTGPGGVTYKSGGADYAEWLPKLDSNENFRFGQIVGVHGGKISLKTSGAENIMAISRTPVVLGNVPPASETDQYEKVGFMGQVYVLVRGLVSTGDYILPSGLEDGTGVAVSPDDLKIEHLGKILGRAWSESSSDIVSMITVAVGLNTNDYTEIIKRQQAQMFERDFEFAALRADHARLKDRMDKVSAKLTAMLASMETMNAFMVSHVDGLGNEVQSTAVAVR